MSRYHYRGGVRSRYPYLGINLSPFAFDQTDSVRGREMDVVREWRRAGLSYARFSRLYGTYDWYDPAHDVVVASELKALYVTPIVCVFAQDRAFWDVKPSWKSQFLLAEGYAADSTDTYQLARASIGGLRAGILSSDESVLAWFRQRLEEHLSLFPGCVFELINNDVLFWGTDFIDFTTLTSAAHITAYSNLGITVSNAKAAWDKFKNQMLKICPSAFPCGWFLYNDDARGQRFQRVGTESFRFCSEFSNTFSDRETNLLAMLETLKGVQATERPPIACLFNAFPDGYAYYWDTPGLTESLWRSGGPSDAYSVVSTIPNVIARLGALAP